MPFPLSIEIPTLARLLVGGIVLFYLWPRYAFAVEDGVAPFDAVAGYGARMLVVLMLAGYALVAAHIYSWLTLALLVFAVRLLRPRATPGEYELRRGARLAALLLSELDQLGSLPSRVLAGLRPRPRPAGRSSRRWSLYWVVGTLALLAVLAIAAWMRLASPLAHAAIPFSDSDVVIYWVQAIESQVLFPNGIYPEGFHIVIADLARLTAANPIATIRFFGPLVGIMMVASVGYTTYRVSGRIAPAIVAVLVYGALPHFLPYSAVRQVGTDSQEFGNALVLPTLWFVYVSWVRKGTWHRGTALALLLACALTHPVVLLNAAAAAVAATLGAWLTNGVRLATLSWYVRWVALAALIALLPIAVALALGIPLNSSGAAFAAAASHAAAPAISLTARVALAGAAALVLVRGLRLLVRRSDRVDLGVAIAGLLVLLSALAIQQAPRLGIDSLVLASRAGEFLALAEALALGLGLSAVQELLELAHFGVGRWLALGGAVAIAAAAWVQFRPTPLSADAQSRWLPDDFVVAYVKIGTSLPHGTWLAVSDDSGFDYAYGQGFFMTASAFLQHVGTVGRWPVYHAGGVASYAISEDHIFLFVDRRLVVARQYRRVVAPRRSAAQRALGAWIAAWERTHGPLPVYFRGPNVTVYELSKPQGLQSLGALSP